MYSGERETLYLVGTPLPGCNTLNVEECEINFYCSYICDSYFWSNWKYLPQVHKDTQMYLLKRLITFKSKSLYLKKSPSVHSLVSDSDLDLKRIHNNQSSCF